MLNKVQIIGRLGRDPELRYSQSGSPVCTLSVATDEGYTDRDGKKVDRTEWHRVVLYSKAAENCNQFLKKRLPCICGGQPANSQMARPAGARPFLHGDQGAARPVPRQEGRRKAQFI